MTNGPAAGDPARPRLLAIDDDAEVLALVSRLADQAGFDAVTHSDPLRALAEIGDIRADVALVDLCMPGIGGLDVLRAIREAQPDCHVILMTAHPSIDSAIEAVKLGALDYLAKPFDVARLNDLLLTVRKSAERREKLLHAEGELARQFEFRGMVGCSPVMQDLFDSIRRLAPHVRTALVTGETGTGKELVARALHDVADRRARRFVVVNCSAVVETLFESELFGHVRGAFTGATEAKAGLFEAADGGTLFLDEIGELPLSLQPKLLRAVELGEVQRVGSLAPRTVDVRVIAATNRDLAAEQEAGRFRNDLYFRLSVVEIRVPPLRERPEDIPYLTAAFVRECAARLNKPVTGISASAEKVLRRATWPGNVRQLRNVIERACLESDGRILSERDLLAALPATVFSSMPTAAPAPARTELLRTAERTQIMRTLDETGGNKAEAARQLGVSRRSLYRWLDRLGGRR